MIDFMSLDVEGSEVDVLSVFPFERHNITLLAIEKSVGHPPSLMRLLDRHGYRVICHTILDHLYVHTPSLHKVASWAQTAQHGKACHELVFPNAPTCQQANLVHHSHTIVPSLRVMAKASWAWTLLCAMAVERRGEISRLGWTARASVARGECHACPTPRALTLLLLPTEGGSLTFG